MLTRADADAPFKDALDKALLSFRCSPDPDIERFLHEDAIPYYKRKLCSVYLLLNEEAFFDGRLQIDAYFTLSHKSIIAEEVETSNTQKKKVTGGFADKPILEFVLIGQLGKHVEKLDDGTTYRADISGEEILDNAFDIMQQASLLIPSRCALVECSNEPKVRKVYEDYRFTFLQHDGVHNQYYKII